MKSLAPSLCAFVAVTCLAAGALAQPQYTLVQINTFDKHNSAYDISDNGRYICGYFLESSGLDARAFLYDRQTDTATDLTPLIEGQTNFPWAMAYAVNDAGQVTGTCETAISQSETTAFLYDHASQTVQLLEFPDSDHGCGHDINAAGHVAGVTQDSLSRNRAFMYDGTTMHDLDLFSDGGQTAFAYALNDSDQLVGTAYRAGGQQMAYWEDESTSIAHLVSGSPKFGRPWDINENGRICGFSLTDVASFVYDRPQDDFSVLPLAPDCNTHGEAQACNDEGLVVGYCKCGSADFYATLWARGQADPDWSVYDLNDLVVNLPVDWTLRQARGVNNMKQIVGYAHVEGEVFGRAYLLTPEPATAALLALGVLPLLCRKRVGH